MVLTSSPARIHFARSIQYGGVWLMIAAAAIASFIWFPVAAAVSGIAGLLVGTGWALREVWRWYDMRYPVDMIRRASLQRRSSPTETDPQKPILPAASLRGA